ncbi:hypothetical protein AF72_09780 [Xylella taiwanensis]|uniref:Uncharacterized protein n=1 Tax=Xylella taiwanensis TaxID=1444770 RepID=Z9JIN3_9GAMM|nr:hypothetical protein AF72_09780 [Xylella taiwanensis]
MLHEVFVAEMAGTNTLAMLGCEVTDCSHSKFTQM